MENLPGASGILAHQAAARATADGYTFLFTNTSGLAINPVTFKSLPYDPAKDFTPVAMVVDFGPQMLSVNVELPVKIRRRTDRLRQSQPRQAVLRASTSPRAQRRLRRGSSTSAPISAWSRCPTARRRRWRRTSASGTVPVLISSMAAANAMVQAGKLRRLAISSTKRFPPLPDLPTINETVPGVTMDGWFVVVAPAGVPAEAVQAHEREIGEFLKGERSTSGWPASASAPAAPARRSRPATSSAANRRSGARWRRS